MTTPELIRARILEALEADLIGPFHLGAAAGSGGAAPPAEVLSLPPSRWYLTGFLAPLGDRETRTSSSSSRWSSRCSTRAGSGRAFAAAHPKALGPEAVASIASDHTDVVLRDHAPAEQPDPTISTVSASYLRSQLRIPSMFDASSEHAPL